jgi:hypothetical protein
LQYFSDVPRDCWRRLKLQEAEKGLVNSIMWLDGISKPEMDGGWV